MSDALLGIGYAAIGIILVFGASEAYDAYKYSHHPNESIRKEVITWGTILLSWLVAVFLVGHI
jgi:hypothetical protein